MSRMHGAARQFTSKNDQSEAPLCVPESASSEQHFVVVQAVDFSVHRQSAFELVETVVGRLTSHFA